MDGMMGRVGANSRGVRGRALRDCGVTAGKMDQVGAIKSQTRGRVLRICVVVDSIEGSGVGMVDIRCQGLWM